MQKTRDLSQVHLNIVPLIKHQFIIEIFYIYKANG